MTSVRFNGQFQFPRLKPEDKQEVEKIVQKKLDRYADKHEGYATNTQWEDGDTFNIETNRPQKILGFIKSKGDTDLLDYLIKSGLNDANEIRRAALANEKENAARENRAEKALPAEIHFRYKR